MTELSTLFPKAQSRPITVKSLFPEVEKIKTYGSGFKTRWISSNRPHPTLMCDLGGKMVMWLVNKQEKRPTTNQLSFVSSFGANFNFSGSENDAWRRIGNSVPPLFMKSIATQIYSVLWGGGALKPYSKSLHYRQILLSAWQQHLAIKGTNAPTVISTFAGAGGSSLGFSMAGYRELLAVDLNANAVATFKSNFPYVPVYHGDIAKLSVVECLELAGLRKPGELFLLDGSPPCQGFSMAGKRSLSDPRNNLFKEFARLLKGLKPKVFVMENVTGLVKGKMKLIFVEILKELKGCGYEVQARVLNSKYFYVPQSRERLIFIGVRAD